jgi:hypothetical protein
MLSPVSWHSHFELTKPASSAETTSPDGRSLIFLTASECDVRVGPGSIDGRRQTLMLPSLLAEYKLSPTTDKVYTNDSCAFTSVMKLKSFWLQIYSLKYLPNYNNIAPKK